MATKKANGNGKSTALVPWDQKFAKYAKEQKEQTKGIAGGGLGVKFGRGSISVGGAAVPGGRLECVIVGSCAVNKWYEADYDPDQATPPDCYAFAVVADDEEMAPHEQAANKQAEKCAECEKNQFGSASTGRGKACANTVRLGLILAKDAEDGKGAATAEMATAHVSPTNLKSWKAYVDALDELKGGRPTWAVVTEISSHDDPKKQIRLEFRLVGEIDDDATLTALEKRYAKIQDALQVPYAAAAERPKPAKGAANRKFAAQGKAAKR